MTPDAIASLLGRVGPYVWYRGPVSLPAHPGKVLHAFVVSEKPHTQAGWHKERTAMVGFWGDEDNDDVSTTVDEVNRLIPEGIERYNGHNRPVTTIDGNGFYGGYDQIKPSNAHG